MNTKEKRTSDRVVPMVSDEEMIVIEMGEQRHLAKMMDLSDNGTLVYLLADVEEAIFPGTSAFRFTIAAFS
jgi:hypothetical protein